MDKKNHKTKNKLDNAINNTSTASTPLKDLRDIYKRLDKFLSEEYEAVNGGYWRPYLDRVIMHKDTILKIAKRYATPLYVLDEEYLKQRAREFVKVFSYHVPKSRIFYSFKSNDLPWGIKKIKECSLDAEVSGIFELKLALKLGFSKIIFNSPVKSDEELRFAMLNSGKVWINVSNIDELKTIIAMTYEEGQKNKIKNPVRISFHLNLDDNPFAKFGLNQAELFDALSIVDDSSLSFEGLHIHKSLNTNSKYYTDSIIKIAKLIDKMEPKHREMIKFIDFGGGFVPECFAMLVSNDNFSRLVNLLELSNLDGLYLNKVVKLKYSTLENYAKDIAGAIESYIEPRLHNIEYWFEPGRWISSLPTLILVKVFSIKGDKIFVDGGTNLIGSANSLNTYSPILNISQPSFTYNKATIYGSLCDSNDVWGYQYFGKGCKRGDILAILHQGAYTFSTAQRFVKPISPYISFSRDKITLVRKKEIFKHRYAGCLL